ncbi:hypothetical protein ElyMa_005330000 [Elysia marginata]|uniref:Uncharacterized protein n=1 Tax=Elysia marginata TaxID=1093978 RepID=A0AAV4K0N1_9GAST|nr:hypothetical protein ElyMa_005330000 [Elysia marginata]
MHFSPACEHLQFMHLDLHRQWINSLQELAASGRRVHIGFHFSGDVHPHRPGDGRSQDFDVNLPQWNLACRIDLLIPFPSIHFPVPGCLKLSRLSSRCEIHQTI